MIINFDDYRKVPVIYASEIADFENIATLHHLDHYVSAQIPDLAQQFDTSILSENTVIRNNDSYLKHLYNEQRQIELSDEYTRYCRASWKNDEEE